MAKGIPILVRTGTFVSALLLATAPAPADEIFVATTGSDTTGNGTIGNPYKTVDHAMDQAVSGDIITIRAGTYTGGQWFETPGITMRGYEGEYVHLNGSGKAVCLWFWTSNCAAINMEITGGSQHNIKFEGPNGCNNLVQDCVIHTCGEDNLKITPNADDNVIRNCEIYDTSLEGIDNVNGDRMIVDSCWVHDAGKNGIYAKGGAIDCIIENCVVSECGEAGIMLGQATGDAYFDPAANPEYFENIDGIVRNCLVTNCMWSGIVCTGALRPKVYNNTIINVDKNGWKGAIKTLSMPHLTFPGECRDITIVNNLIVFTRNMNNELFTDFMSLVTAGATNVMDYNIYWDNNNPMWRAPALGVTANSIANWRSGTGFDANSALTDPQLDASYYLTASSPCIDAGDATTDCVEDKDGVSRPLDGDNDTFAYQDVGCYEYVHPEANTDGDGHLDADEVIADTDATDSDSILAVTAIGRDPLGVKVSWQGGEKARQVIESCTDLRTTVWTPVYTNNPPTATETNTVLVGVTNTALLYRIRAERP